MQASTNLKAHSDVSDDFDEESARPHRRSVREMLKRGSTELLKDGDLFDSFNANGSKRDSNRISERMSNVPESLPIIHKRDISVQKIEIGERKAKISEQPSQLHKLLERHHSDDVIEGISSGEYPYPKTYPMLEPTLTDDTEGASSFQETTPNPSRFQQNSRYKSSSPRSPDARFACNVWVPRTYDDPDNVVKVEMVVDATCTVKQLIQLAISRYKDQESGQGYIGVVKCLRYAEEDGEMDEDLPAFSSDRVAADTGTSDFYLELTRPKPDSYKPEKPRIREGSDAATPLLDKSNCCENCIIS